MFQPTMDTEIQQAIATETTTTIASSDKSGVDAIGEDSNTPFGPGRITGYRPEDDMYVIRLNENTKLYSKLPYLLTSEEKEEKRLKEAENLNMAYEAFEKMRRLNLELKCAEIGIKNVDHSVCTVCLLSGVYEEKKSHFPRLQKFVDDAASMTATTTSASSSSSFPRIQNLWGKATAGLNPTAVNPQTSEAQADTPPSDGASVPASAQTTTTAQSRIQSFWGRATSSLNPTAANTPGPASAPAPTNTNSGAAPAPAPANAPESNGDQKKKPSSSTMVLPRIQKLLDDRAKASVAPCLICASPTCRSHSSDSFRKEGITLCHSCERMFELSFIVDCVSTPDAKERAKHVDDMISLYDRSILLLKYSSQYIESVANVLEAKKEKSNMIGLGSSSAGIVSGVLGVAAAVTILTPAGPPLLVASLVFGGGATAVQTGNDAVNYFSEPNKLADRIIALHGMTHSILRVTSTLRDAMMRDHIRTDAYVVEESSLPEKVQESLEKNRAGVLAGANVGRSITLGGAASMEVGGAVASAEAGIIGARSATTLSRAGTAAARTIRFARFAGGALSAAVLVLEANAIKSTLESIHAGNPCDKANNLRKIREDIDNLPSTESLERECQAYLSALAERRAVTTDTALPQSSDELIPTVPVEDLQLIVDGEDDIVVAGTTTDGVADVTAVPETAEATAAANLSNSLGGSSLLERIQMHKEREQLMEESTNDVNSTNDNTNTTQGNDDTPQEGETMENNTQNQNPNTESNSTDNQTTG